MQKINLELWTKHVDLEKAIDDVMVKLMGLKMSIATGAL
jgi:hypothetical protein